MHAPPPPIQRKRSPLVPILLVLGLGMVVLLGLCAFGGYVGFKWMKAEPKARQGFGNPSVVAYLADGWATYQFKEVPMNMDLPAIPKKDMVQFEAGSNLVTKEWIYYTCTSDLNGIELVGNWYRSLELVDLDDEADYVEDWVKETYSVGSLKKSSKNFAIGRLKGREVSGTFVDEGDSMNFKCLVWSHDKAVFNLYAYYYPSEAAAAEKELYRIAKSVTMR